MFIEADIEVILEKLNKLEPAQKPLWGSMNAQRMVEHLTDIIRISNGKNPLELLIPEDRLERMVQFLDSDKPMAQGIEVPFAGKEVPLRTSELELAIDEFTEEWVDFQEHFEETEGRTELHPYYGNLNYDQWKRLHSKHITHHLTQFGLL